MNCRKLQAKIVQSGAAGLSGEQRRHLAECPECRAFDEAWRRLRDWHAACEGRGEGAEVPSQLDFAVKRQARLRLSGLQPRLDSVGGGMPAILRFGRLAAIGLVILAVGLWLTLSDDPSPAPEAGSTGRPQGGREVLAVEPMEDWWREFEEDMAVLELELAFELAEWQMHDHHWMAELEWE